MKTYVPVGNFERQTTHCPTYLAWLVLDEVRDYLRTALPDSYADQLAQRAERVFAKNPFWQRRYRSTRGREELLASLRHWLAGIFATEKPALFRALPESYKLGQPLPDHPLTPPAKQFPSPAPLSLPRFFVHGWELLSV